MSTDSNLKVISWFNPFLSDSRKGQEVESRVSNPSREDQPQVQTDQSGPSSEGSGCGHLPVDRGLQTHISHTLTSLSSLPTLADQALALARSAESLIQVEI